MKDFKVTLTLNLLLSISICLRIINVRNELFLSRFRKTSLNPFELFPETTEEKNSNFSLVFICSPTLSESLQTNQVKIPFCDQTGVFGSVELINNHLKNLHLNYTGKETDELRILYKVLDDKQIPQLVFDQEFSVIDRIPIDLVDYEFKITNPEKDGWARNPVLRIVPTYLTSFPENRITVVTHISFPGEFKLEKGFLFININTKQPGRL